MIIEFNILYLIPRTIRDVRLAINSEVLAVGIDNRNGIVMGVVGSLEEGHC